MEDSKLSTKLQRTHYESLALGYGEWLSRLGYNGQMVQGFPNQVREFLHWLEWKGIQEIAELNQSLALAFMTYFSGRPHRRSGGGLSVAHINKQTYSLNLFFKYLCLLGELSSSIELPYQAKELQKDRLVLSESEVRLLYESCGSDALGQRDRAMLSIYYGCGLRRSEGVYLELGDVNLVSGLLHVKRGKNGWERYVPMAMGVKEDLERYIYGGRQLLASRDSSVRLFLTERGKDLSGQSLLRNLKCLLERSGIDKVVTLHSLRHSIATHLLSGGMSLEEVGSFLGHRALNSTQLYTHLKTRTWIKG